MINYKYNLYIKIIIFIINKMSKLVEISLEEDDNFTIKEQEIISKFTTKIKDRTKYALSGVLIGSFMNPLSAILLIIIFCVLTGDTYYIKDGIYLLYQFLYTLYIKNSKKHI